MNQELGPFPSTIAGNSSGDFFESAAGDPIVVRRGSLAGAVGVLVNSDDAGRCVVRLLGSQPGVYLAMSQEFLARA